jgi:uncharacterized membrane protein YoaK (UPF0700 family)
MRTTTTMILVQILGFVGGWTVSSIFITKSENWKISLPIFLITLVILIINIILNRKEKKDGNSKIRV